MEKSVWVQVPSPTFFNYGVFLQILETDGKLNLSINLLKESKFLAAFFCLSFIFILFILYSFYDFIDNNQKIQISCNKTKNLCKIETDKLFLGKTSQQFSLNLVEEAKLHNVYCSKLSCYYNIQIPYKTKRNYIKLYSSSENEDVLEWFVKEFNNYKHDRQINQIYINNYQAPIFISDTNLMLINIIIFIIIFLFAADIKVQIIIDLDNYNFILVRKKIIGQKVKNIQLNKIKSFEIVKHKNFATVQYRLQIGAPYQIVSLNNIEKSEKLCNLLNNYLINNTNNTVPLPP